MKYYNSEMRKQVDNIIKESINGVLPDKSVFNFIEEFNKKKISGKIYMVAVGKAAWQMANAAYNKLNLPIERGIVITKYKHIKGKIGQGEIECYEAGHPVPDKNTYRATEKVLEMTKNLSREDVVLFLLSGGGSALFEKTKIEPDKIERITKDLLACGANIKEINSIRKRFSEVKGGRFAKWCEPAKIETLILSDIIGDSVDMIASGPTATDTATSKDVFNIIRKYNLEITDDMKKVLEIETPKVINNSNNTVVGSVSHLCNAAKEICEKLGYEVEIISTSWEIEAKVAGIQLSNKVCEAVNQRKSLTNKKAFIVGGETIVYLKGNGLGGRNQEVAISAAMGISGYKNVCIFSIGSDGTDGPTDAAGGYVDGETVENLRKAGIDIKDILDNNDSYHALEKIGGLIKTGPTGTNVNDLMVALII